MNSCFITLTCLTFFIWEVKPAHEKKCIVNVSIIQSAKTIANEREIGYGFTYIDKMGIVKESPEEVFKRIKECK